jgi:hypothetical protein
MTASIACADTLTCKFTQARHEMGTPFKIHFSDTTSPRASYVDEYKTILTADLDNETTDIEYIKDSHIFFKNFANQADLKYNQVTQSYEGQVYLSFYGRSGNGMIRFGLVSCK